MPYTAEIVDNSHPILKNRRTVVINNENGTTQSAELDLVTLHEGNKIFLHTSHNNKSLVELDESSYKRIVDAKASRKSAVQTPLIPTSTNAKRVQGWSASTGSSHGFSPSPVFTYSKNSVSKVAALQASPKIKIQATPPKKHKFGADDSEIEKVDIFAEQPSLVSKTPNKPQIVAKPTHGVKLLFQNSNVPNENKSPIASIEKPLFSTKTTRSSEASILNPKSMNLSDVFNNTSATSDAPFSGSSASAQQGNFRYPSLATSVRLQLSDEPDLVRADIERKGFPNPSCVCYANAVTQALISCEKFGDEMLLPFWEEILSSRNTSAPEAKVFQGVKRCFLAAGTGEHANPSAWIRAFLGPSFASTTSQEDAHEFFMAVLHKIDVELGGEGVGDKRIGAFRSQILSRIAKQYPNFPIEKFTMPKVLPTCRVFEAQLQKEMTCTNCHYFHKATPETHLVHSLDFLSLAEATNGLDLVDLFNRNFHDEHPRELKCEKCQVGNQASVRTNFVQLPRILVCHIKRFISSSVTTTKRKDRVNAPLIINIRSVVSNETIPYERPDLTPPPTETALLEGTYELTACVFHEGSRASSGHYTTAALVDQAWYFFDDEKVSKLPKDWHERESFKRAAYIYFYRLLE
jgi:ubiquitin C-terminal hydrolase